MLSTEARTSEEWLRRLDANKQKAMPILAETYGQENAKIWYNRWRVFYLSVAVREIWFTPST